MRRLVTLPAIVERMNHWIGNRGRFEILSRHERDDSPMVVVHWFDENGDPFRSTSVLIEDMAREVGTLAEDEFVQGIGPMRTEEGDEWKKSGGNG